MSRHIRLDDDVYERIKSSNREDETFSDTVERLIEGWSLRDLRDVFDDEQVSEMREAIDEPDERDRDETREVAERFE
jgi:predicted CopG family antitoxin